MEIKEMQSILDGLLAKKQNAKTIKWIRTLEEKIEEQTIKQLRENKEN